MQKVYREYAVSMQKVWLLVCQHEEGGESRADVAGSHWVFVPVSRYHRTDSSVMVFTLYLYGIYIVFRSKLSKTDEIKKEVRFISE